MTWKSLRVLVLLALAPIGACSCDEDIFLEAAPGSCEPTFPCQAGLTYRQGACQVERCLDTDECCPGQQCITSTGLCVNRWKACTADEECVDIPGQRCIDFRGGQFCGYPNRDRVLSESQTQACDQDLDCPDNTRCVGRRCLSSAPCSGGCPDGQVCDVDSNTCFPYEGCGEQSCGDGEVLVVADPDPMSGPACCLIECACAVLPPTPLGQFGFHSDLALQPGSAAVSAYDQTFGDLVVVELSRSSAQLGVHYVDGFPDEGPIVGNPTDRRNGRILPGPDVGEYSSIVRDSSGTLHVAYYDRTNGHLKYARGQGAEWAYHVVDNNGQVGLFTSIALNERGFPVIAYMAVETRISGESFNGLMFAEARLARPSRTGDWGITPVDIIARPPPICGGGCEAGTACVDLGDGPQCAETRLDCGESCTASQICIDSPTGTRCAAEVATVSSGDLPQGTGLFASVVVDSGGGVHIAYYDRLQSRLRIAEKPRGSSFEARTLHGGSTSDPLDVGAHASLAISLDDRLAVAYMDLTHEDLLFLDLEQGVPEIIDDGITAPDLRQVGADASLVFDSRGQPAVAYQDASFLNLVYARRVPGDTPSWRREVLRGLEGSEQEAAGFYVSQEVSGDEAWVSSVSVKFDQDSNLDLDLSVDVVPLQ